MTEYTPEKVADLIAEARSRVHAHRELSRRMGGQGLKLSELYEDHAAMADALEVVSAERDRARSGAKTLGEIVERQVEDTLRWAGMEDQIGMDDPDQQLAWELCAEMPGKIATLLSDRDRLHKAITEALSFESVLPAIATEPRRILRAALDKEGNDET